MRAAGDGAGVSPRRVEGHVVVHPRNLHLPPKPGGPSPQEPGLDVQPASGSWFFFLPPPAPSVIMNYDLILARPHQHTGHCTPRHLDRQCHRTGLRWLPLQQGTSSCYLPARRPTASPVPSLPPCTRDERDQVFGIPPGLGHSVYWPAAAPATTGYEESGEKVIGTGSKWLWLWCWVIMSDMMGGGSHLPARAGQARWISAEQLPSRADQR